MECRVIRFGRPFMRVFGQSLAILLFAAAVLVGCAGMRHAAQPVPLSTAATLESRIPSASPGDPEPARIASPAGQPGTTPELVAALPAPPPLTPVPGLPVTAELVRVHTARTPERIVLMLDFTSAVRCETEYEVAGNRLGLLISPVERQGVASQLGELSGAFGPVTIESGSSQLQKVTLTLPEGVAPSAHCRTLATLGRTHIFDFDVLQEDRSAELPAASPAGKLTSGQRASKGRGFTTYRYRWIARDGTGSDVFVHRVDPARGDFDIKLALAHGRIHARQPLSAIASASSALAGINAGFFAIHGNGDPLGLLVADGKLLAAPVFRRSAVGLFPGGRVLFGNPELSGRIRTRRGQAVIDGLNQARQDGKLILYTHEYGARTGTVEDGFEAAVSGGRVVAVGSRDLAIPPGGFAISHQGELPAAMHALAAGDAVDYQVGLTPPWNSSQLAIGAGPRLVRGGEVLVAHDEERFRREFAMTRAPRTGVGLTASGKVLMVAVDGRRPRASVGVSLPEFAHIFRSLGAVEALNMDGGGSTTSWLDGRTVNRPSDGRERPISSALIVVPRAPERLATQAARPAAPTEG